MFLQISINLRSDGPITTVSLLWSVFETMTTEEHRWGAFGNNQDGCSGCGTFWWRRYSISIEHTGWYIFAKRITIRCTQSFFERKYVFSIVLYQYKCAILLGKLILIITPLWLTEKTKWNCCIVNDFSLCFCSVNVCYCWYTGKRQCFKWKGPWPSLNNKAVPWEMNEG